MPSASIDDMGAGRWRIRWRQRTSRKAPWRQKQHTIYGTESDAERYRADVIDDLRRQGFHDPAEHAPKIAPPASLLDGLMAYVDAMAAHGRKSGTIVRSRLRVGVLAEAMYEVLDLPADEPVPVTVLDRNLFIELVPVLARRGTTVPTHALSLLWRAWGWLMGDPAAWPRVPVRPPLPEGFVPAQAAYGRTVAPTLAHADAALRHLRARSVGRGTVVAVVMQRFTGLRVGQVLAIEREDLDLSEGLLTVRVGKSGREQADMRTIPLSRKLLSESLFCELLDAAPATGRIFRVKRITATVKRAWQAATDAGEAPRHVWAPKNRRNARPDHAFRAALQAWLWKERTPRDVADWLVGHSGGMQATHYGRDLLDDARKAVDGLPPVDWRGGELPADVTDLDSVRAASGGS